MVPEVQGVIYVFLYSLLFDYDAEFVIESELTCWDEGSKVLQQWPEEEREVLSPTGRSMMQMLGDNIARRYVLSGDLGVEASNAPLVLWRSSKSSRSTESGTDFCTGFDAALGKQVDMLGSAIATSIS